MQSSSNNCPICTIGFVASNVTVSNNLRLFQISEHDQNSSKRPTAGPKFRSGGYHGSELILQSSCWSHGGSYISVFRFFVLFEFRSFRSGRTIAGSGGVVGPLPRPNKVGEPPVSKKPKRPNIFFIPFFV